MIHIYIFFYNAYILESLQFIGTIYANALLEKQRVHSVSQKNPRDIRRIPLSSLHP